MIVDQIEAFPEPISLLMPMVRLMGTSPVRYQSGLDPCQRSIPGIRSIWPPLLVREHQAALIHVPQCVEVTNIYAVTFIPVSLGTRTCSKNVS